MPSIVVALVAAAIGITAWELVALIHPGREPWDVREYWLYGYPLMIGASAGLGFLAPRHPVRWGFAVGMGQGVWGLARSSLHAGVSNLWPLSLLIFAVVSLPCVAAAWAGAWLAQYLDD